MPAGPHVPSIDYIRKALEGIPGAIRYDDPSTDARGSGTCPAISVRISDPDRERNGRDVLDTNLEDAPDVDAGSDEAVVDEPVLAFEIPPEVTEFEIQHALGNELAKIEQLSQLHGLDAYGWYTTLHQKRFQYGVHIPVEGILAFAVHAFADLDLPLERKAQLAFNAILRHELFHFNVDCMIANWEMATGVSVFWDAKEHSGNQHGYVPMEEGLANAYMLRGFRYPSRALVNSAGAYQALKRFCERQPEGYRDAARYVKTRGPYLALNSFFDACAELSASYRLASKPIWSPPEALDALLFYPDLIRIDWTRCPIIVLDEHGLQGVLGIGVSHYQVVTNIEETLNFTRSLHRLDKSIQKRWQENKGKLALSTSFNSLGFQQWKKDGADYFSVRVGGNDRAHLRRDGEKWLAEAIGNHKKMGHG